MVLSVRSLQNPTAVQGAAEGVSPQAGTRSARGQPGLVAPGRVTQLVLEMQRLNVL